MGFGTQPGNMMSSSEGQVSRFTQDLINYMNKMGECDLPADLVQMPENMKNYADFMQSGEASFTLVTDEFYKSQKLAEAQNEIYALKKQLREGQQKQIELKRYLTLMTSKARPAYISIIEQMRALEPELSANIAETMTHMTDDEIGMPALNSKITYMHKSVSVFNRVVVCLVGAKNLYSSTETADVKFSQPPASASSDSAN